MATAAEIVTEALQLPESERDWVVSRILHSYEHKQELSPAWKKEIAERIARREAGETRHVSREELHRDIQKILSS